MENSLFKLPVIDFIQKGQTVMDRKAFLLSLLFANCWLGSQQALGVAAAEIAPGGPIQEQNQGDCYGNLKELPIEMIIQVAQYLDYKSLKNLMGANSTFHALVKDPHFQNALKAREVQGLLYRISTLEPAKLYTAVSLDEIMAAVSEGREPWHLAVIHEAYGIRLREFLGGITVGESREERIRHGIKLILLMNATGSTAGSAALDAASDAAGDAASDAVCSSGSAPRDASGNIPGETTLDAAREAAASAPLDAACDAAGSAALEAAETSLDAASDALCEAAWFAAREVLRTSQNLSPQEKGRLAYRVAEVSALLSILKCALDDSSKEFGEFFSKVYQASDEFLTNVPEDLSIWQSQKAWDAFYAKHFGKLKPDALAFLTPFLREIKKMRLSRAQV
jgi:hypothetical protein